MGARIRGGYDATSPSVIASISDDNIIDLANTSKFCSARTLIL